MDTTQTTCELGAHIREERKAHGLSQQQLAERAGCSQRFVSELEHGKATAELGKVTAVAEALGLKLALSPTAANKASRPTPRLKDYL